MSALPDSPLEWVALLAAYLLGSVPFGYLLGRLKGVDIRSGGSGNIGATNAGRMLGRPWGIAAFVGDFGKGWFSAWWLGPELASDPARGSTLAVLCGAAAVCGHVWPVYLRFKGGKAVATGCGAVVGVDPLVFLIGGGVWLASLAVFRFVGLSSMLMAVAFPVSAYLRRDSQGYGMEVVWGTTALALLVLWRHRANVRRMLAGTEPRFGRARS